MTRRILFASCASLGITVLLSGCGGEGDGAAEGGSSEQKNRIAYITNGVADFWTIAEAGANQAAADVGAESMVLMPSSLTDQKQMMEDVITRGVDGVAVSPIDSENQTDMLNEVAAATLLATHDSDAPQSDRLLYIGMDNYTAGRMCGALVKEALPDGGEVAILIGRMEQDNARQRRQGVIDELLDRDEDSSRFDAGDQPLKGDKYTILTTLTDGFDMAKAKANAEDALSRYPDIDAMVGLFAYNPPAILQALEQAGKLNEIEVIGFDEQEETLAAIQAGTVYGTVVQNPYMYGYKSVELLNAIANGDKSVIPENGIVHIDGRQIRKDNVEEFWADLKEKTGKE